MNDVTHMVNVILKLNLVTTDESRVFVGESKTWLYNINMRHLQACTHVTHGDDVTLTWVVRGEAVSCVDVLRLAVHL